MTPNNDSTANDAALEAALSDPPTKPDNSGDTLDIRVAQLEGELKRANNEVLKSQAEFENFRKRMRREMEEDSRYAALPLITELLPVIDNLQRAVDAAEQAGAHGGLVDGVKMVINQFNAALARVGCVKIEAAGAEFDPHVHAALMQEPSAEVPANHVSRELQSGYKMHDRVVRPAQVFVSTGKGA
jgi:molecular chaperone GrpE